MGKLCRLAPQGIPSPGQRRVVLLRLVNSVVRDGLPDDVTRDHLVDTLFVWCLSYGQGSRDIVNKSRSWLLRELEDLVDGAFEYRDSILERLRKHSLLIDEAVVQELRAFVDHNYVARHAAKVLAQIQISQRPGVEFHLANEYISRVTGLSSRDKTSQVKRALYRAKWLILVRRGNNLTHQADKVVLRDGQKESSK
jgi:hypothetical protein